MFKRPLLKEIFWLSLTVAFLHWIALKFYFYWTIDWFDILMHLMGGFLISLISIFILSSFLHIETLNNKKVCVILVLSFVLIVGLGWELYELFFGMTDIFEDRVDTIIDLIMDLIGGYFAFLYGKKHLWRTN